MQYNTVVSLHVARHLIINGFILTPRPEVVPCYFHVTEQQASVHTTLTAAAPASSTFSGLIFGVGRNKNGLAHAVVRFPVSPAAGVQVAAEAVLRSVSLHVHSLSRRPQDAGHLRPSGHAAGGRQFLRLRLGP